MAKRQKKTIVQDVKSDQFEEAMANYAAADAQIAKINATMDEQITRIREKYADKLTELEQHREQCFEVAQAYCTENQDVLFANKKSLETAHGTVGFRTGTPKLATLKGFTWASVQTLLETLKPEYLRTKTEPNKEKLLTDRELLAADLPKLGLEVKQDESFFVELKKEEQAL